LDRKISVGAVGYLNTKPLIHGILRSPVSDRLELLLDHPASLVRRLLAGEIDLGLIPVGALPSIPGARIVSDHCIGTEGEVASVAVFSESSVSDIRTVWLDYQSRTSVRLCRLLFERHLKRTDIRYKDARDEGYIGEIKGDAAGLVIGDRALRLHDRFPHRYDLGLLWKEFTGLPFVFACWVSTKELDPDFIAAFNEANRAGLADLENAVKGVVLPEYDMGRYFRENISYTLDDAKREGMRIFLDMLTES
jgi:chorismate dehydratase